MIWRNISLVRENFLFFHTHSVEIWKFFSHDFLQTFRQSNFFTKELYCKLIWRKNSEVGENFWHTVWKCQKFIPISNIFRESNLQYNSLVKKLLWRNFCKKIVGKNFFKFPQCVLRQFFPVKMKQFFSCSFAGNNS